MPDPKVSHIARRFLLYSGLAVAALVLIWLVVSAMVVFPWASYEQKLSSGENSIRSLRRAEREYFKANPQKGYTCDLETLRRSELLPDGISTGHVSIYLIALSGCDEAASDHHGSTFTAIAIPVSQDSSRYFAFCTSEEGIVKASGTARTAEDCLKTGSVVPEQKLDKRSY